MNVYQIIKEPHLIVGQNVQLVVSALQIGLAINLNVQIHVEVHVDWVHIVKSLIIVLYVVVQPEVLVIHLLYVKRFSILYQNQRSRSNRVDPVLVDPTVSVAQ